jgi:hypothetical protein
MHWSSCYYYLLADRSTKCIVQLCDFTFIEHLTMVYAHALPQSGEAVTRL